MLGTQKKPVGERISNKRRRHPTFAGKKTQNGCDASSPYSRFVKNEQDVLKLAAAWGGGEKKGKKKEEGQGLP